MLSKMVTHECPWEGYKIIKGMNRNEYNVQKRIDKLKRKNEISSDRKWDQIKGFVSPD